ncbi:MAG: YjbQ family protein [Stellaceae bacterium]
MFGATSTLFCAGSCRRTSRFTATTTKGRTTLPAHIKSALTQTQLSIPVTDGRPQLGTWQGIFLLEHRASPHRRSVVLTLIGEEE